MKTLARANKDGRFFVETISPRENSEKAYCPPSHGPDEYRGDSIIGGAMWDARLGKAAHGGAILAAFSMGRRTHSPKSTIWKWLAWAAIMTIVILTLLGCSSEPAWASSITTECSYYTVASTIREGTGSGIGLTASGEILRDDGEYTFAHATLPFGTRCRITKLDRKGLPGVSIVARCNDRGPSARLRRLGRQIDTNLSAARALGIVQSGVALVTVEWMR